MSTLMLALPVPHLDAVIRTLSPEAHENGMMTG